MINPARFDAQYAKVGGVFRTTVLLQKRLRELNRGAKRLVEENPKNPIELVLVEVGADRIELVTDNDANRDRQRTEVERMTPGQPAGTVIPEHISDQELESRILSALRKDS
ncbi:MAG: hypothetical protein EXS14_09925 [Planctomycetes bacterium]|nr:hypothetical protein [Planctomycetota bacterium]